MKTINFLAVLSLVFSLSCKKDSANTTSGNLTLELVAEKNVSTNNNASDVDNTVAVLDVTSYNATTGEIAFNEKQLPDMVGGWKEVKVYHKDAYLFTLTFSKPIFSQLINKPVLYHSLIDIEVEGSVKEKNKWYILSGYPYGKLLGEQTITDAEQLMNFQKIKSNWDVFIGELKKSGKYIN